MAKKEPSKTQQQYIELADKLARKNNGLSVTAENKLLNITDGDEDRTSILDKMTAAFHQEENSSIIKIEGKHKNERIRDTITGILESNDFAEMVAGGINNVTSEKIREQRYIRQFMPQVAKSIDAMVTCICSPNTQTKESIELSKISGKTTINEMRMVLKNKKVDVVVRDCIQAALDHGVGYMYILPYKKMAEDVLEIAKLAGNNKINSDKKHAQYNEEVTMMSSSIQSPEDGILYQESSNGDKFIGGKLFSESIKLISTPEKYEEKQTTKTKYFSESPILSPASSLFKVRADKLFKESNGNKYNMKYMNKIDGCYIEKLDNEKCIPIYINKHLVGIYYIEDEFQNIMKQVQSQKGKLRDDITQKADLSLRIKEEIVNILKDEVDEKFLAINKHVIASIDSLMKDMKRSNTEFRIRFIPADYLVEFTNYYRQSQMALVESLAHCWIMLFKNYVFTELFYKKDKIITKYNIDYDDDIGSQGNRLLDTIRNMVPLPSEILNLRKMYMGLISSQRLMIPRTKNQEMFDIERIEGQKDNGEAFENLLKIQGMVTELIGFNYNMLDPSANADFALQIVNADRNKAEMILSLQKLFNDPLRQAINLILKYEFQDDTNIEVDAKFSEMREVRQQIFAEQLGKITERIDLISAFMLPEDADADKKYYFRQKLFKILAAMFINIDELEEILDEYDRENATKEEKNEEDDSINDDTSGDEMYE